MPLDPQALQGFSTGADEYDRHRPGWPERAVDIALERLGLASDASLLDLAAGTGKLTRLLVPRAAHVVAVEPLEDMRSVLADVAPEADVRDGEADAIPLEDGSVDAVFVAEAFHWFATREAASEMARVVRPAGGAVLMWNMHAFNDAPWTAPVGEVLDEYMPQSALQNARNSPERWQDAFAGSPFEPFSTYEVPNELRTDADGLVGHVMTWSHTRVMAAEVRDAMAGALRDALAAGRAISSEIVIPFRTEVYVTRRS